MTIDKELYKKTYEQFRQWNEAEFADKVRNAGKVSPDVSWAQYVDLWEFSTSFAPPQSELQQKLRLIDWNKYYDRIRKLEKWRLAHNTSTK